MDTNHSMCGYLFGGIRDKQTTKITYFGRNISSVELIGDIQKVASFLRQNGVKKGDAVGIALPNIPEAVISLYAINFLGGISNLIHPRSSAESLKNILQKTQTNVIFCFPELYYKCKKVLKDKLVILCKPSYFMPICAKIPALFTQIPILFGVIPFSKTLQYPPITDYLDDGESDAVYIHSGGTTGSPKTVVIQNKAINAMAETIVDSVYINDYVREDDAMIATLPIFHSFGLTISFHTALSRCRIVLLPRFIPRLANEHIRKYNVTHLAGVPTMFEKMRKERNFEGEYLKKIVRIYCGGDKLNEKTKVEYEKVLKKYGSIAEIQEGYGLSETSSVCAVSIRGDTKAGCQGTALIGNEIEIRDKDGNKVQSGELGEIYVSSPTLMRCYLNDVITTDEVIKTDANGKRWLKTGDIGCLDAKQRLHFAEREKRSIKISAVNVFPSEIEEVVLQIEAVDDCCVARSTMNGGKPCTELFVKLKPNYAPNKETEEKIINTVKKRLIKYAVPKKISFVNQIRKTNFGKTDYMFYENELKNKTTQK